MTWPGVAVLPVLTAAALGNQQVKSRCPESVEDSGHPTEPNRPQEAIQMQMTLPAPAPAGAAQQSEAAGYRVVYLGRPGSADFGAVSHEAAVRMFCGFIAIPELVEWLASPARPGAVAMLPEDVLVRARCFGGLSRYNPDDDPAERVEISWGSYGALVHVPGGPVSVHVASHLRVGQPTVWEVSPLGAAEARAASTNFEVAVEIALVMGGAR